MIQDADELAEIQRNWAGVEALREQLQVSAFASAAIGIGGRFPFGLANAAQNLPFMHAYAVLNDTLEQLAREMNFEYKGRSLGRLLEHSESTLPWQNFTLIDEGKEHRNGVAHHGKLLERSECWRYINAIKDELCAWGIIDDESAT